jgi:hypothetical protein
MNHRGIALVVAVLFAGCTWNDAAARKAGHWAERAATAGPRAMMDRFPTPGTDKHVVCGPATEAGEELDFPVVCVDRMPKDWKRNRTAAKAACQEHWFPAVVSLTGTIEAKRNLRQMNRTGVFETIRLRFNDEDWLVMSGAELVAPEATNRRRIKTAR